MRVIVLIAGSKGEVKARLTRNKKVEKMAMQHKKGGGFFRGAFYGLLVSAVVFAGLTIGFPLVQNPPMAEISNPVQTAPQAYDVGPGSPDEAGVNVGGVTDTMPNANSGESLSSGAPVEQPVVATQSAAVPDIGNSAQPTENAPSQSTNSQPVVVSDAGETRNTVETAPPLPEAASGEAFDVFSVPFTRDPDLPMMAIIFEDTLEASLELLFNANIPLTFAVPGINSDPQMSRGFRENGFEVLALMPENQPIDDQLSQNISGYIKNVPASIGLIDNFTGGIMRQSPAAQTMIETAAVNGMGTIAFAGPGDINAQNLSRFYNNPFGVVHRMIDETDDIVSIKNALGRATLTAQTSNSAIIYARTRDNTIQALIEWLQTDQAARVQFVPVSQIMRR